MNLINEYSLNPDISNEELENLGFRNGQYKCYLYKQIIKLIIDVDTEDKWWSYRVYDVDIGTLYAPYYNRKYGNNVLVSKIDTKINKIFKEMLENNVFVKEDMTNEKNC